MSARRLQVILVLMAFSIAIAASATTPIPGTLVDSTLSGLFPATESRDPKCIDMSGIDQALEELLMCLRGDEVKTVVSGLSAFDPLDIATAEQDPTGLWGENLSAFRELARRTPQSP